MYSHMLEFGKHADILVRKNNILNTKLSLFCRAFALPLAGCRLAAAPICKYLFVGTQSIVHKNTVTFVTLPSYLTLGNLQHNSMSMRESSALERGQLLV